ncbi:hypothetical protein DH2020_009380 [Rehmannia glutinosa]|uniref:non-specific serine/threonine protein kinase n=1 Tax=Rehmannia glutinosa TaxID=99300 RepID=A0ABR0X649_REHGL
MSKALETSSSSSNDPISLKVSFHDLSINTSPSIDFCSSTVTGSDNTSVGSSKLSFVDKPVDIADVVAGEESEKSSLSSVSYCSGGDANEASFRSVCASKPHKGNDTRWDAIQVVGTCICLGSVSQGKHFTEQAARFYASEVLLALEYLHMMGVVYRDLKPENVLVRDDGHIMLSDFDLSLRCYVNPTLVTSSDTTACTISSYCIQPSCIDPACKLPVCVEPSCFQPSCFKPRLFNSKPAKVRGERTTLSSSDSLPVLVAEPTAARSMSFVGTHEYLAPEIIKGDGHGSAVDWWTFGIFLYELLHGKTPFKVPEIPEGSTISFAAKDLIRGLLAKDPQKRLGFKRGATEIKQHPFFESVNWALIRGTSPPQIPKPIDLASLNQTIKSSLPQITKVVQTQKGPLVLI